MNDLSRAEIIPIKLSASNPLYPQTGRNDITVIILKTPAVTSVVPVATTDELNHSSNLTLVGFGNTDPLGTKGFGKKRKVEVEILAIRRSPLDQLDDSETKFGFESDLEFIAGGNGFDSCNGDSGGPAYIESPAGKKVAGLTSRALLNATHSCGEGGIYTRIDKQLNYINSVGAPYGVELNI